jgi:hypothetical protein
MRIRTIKPEFFEDELLSDLEVSNPGQYIMLTYAGLWGMSDRNGTFEWSPRVLHVHILPLIAYDFDETLRILEASKRIRRFVVDGKMYGHILTFKKHQRINGKEAQENSKYPISTAFLEVEGSSREALGKQSRSIGEALGKQSRRQEGKGREGKGKDIAAKLPQRFPGASPSEPQDATAPASAGIDTDDFPPAEGDRELLFYHAVEKAFLEKNDDRFTDYGKEGAAIKNLIKKASARAPENAEAFLAQMIAEFWKQKETSNAFWKGQPFLPSALNASSIWDRVLEQLRVEQPDPTSMAIARGERI